MMSLYKKIIRVLKNPRKITIYLASKGIINYDDKKYLKFIYKERMGKELNLANPRTFNEKLQWLKLYNRDPYYTKLVDKVEVRNHVKKMIGNEYLIPQIGVYSSPKEIDFKKLPEQFVLKTTHDSGTVIICKDKNSFDQKKAIKILKRRLKRKYFYLFREWPYKNVKPKIVAEKYMASPEQPSLNDYKFYCFNGEPKVMMIIIDRGTNTKMNFYDMNFVKLDVQQCFPNFSQEIEKPKQFEEMKKLCKILSKDMPHVRLDFYIINEKVYFGEYTFFDSAGLDRFEPEKYDEIFGQYIDLEKIK